jgi:hypothetical protein
MEKYSGRISLEKDEVAFLLSGQLLALQAMNGVNIKRFNQLIRKNWKIGKRTNESSV